MKSERLRVWLAFFIVCTVWGSTWLVIKIGVASIPPLLAAGVRFAIAAMVLLIIVRARRIPILMTGEAKKVYLALGLISFSIPFGLVYWAEQYIPSGLSSILFAAYPFWVALFSHLVLKEEPVDAFKLAGIIAGFSGLLFIFSVDVQWADTRTTLGMCAVLCSTMLQAFSLVIIKKYGKPISPLAMNLVGMSIGSVLLLTTSLLFEPVRTAVWNAAAVGSVLYLAVVGSVLTFVSYFWLLKKINAVYLSLTSFINPVVAVLLGAVILGETLTPPVFLGAAFVLLGILVANGKYFYGKLRKTK